MKKEKYFVKQLGYIPPPYGGVSVYIKRLTDQLNKDGYISGGYYLKGNENQQIIKSEFYDEFRWLKTSKFISRFIRLVKETKSYKIVHSHFSLEGMVFLWGLSVLCGKKIVVTVHNSWSDTYYKSTNFINRFFLKQIVRRDITWVAVSEEAKKNMEKLSVKFGQIIVIPAFIPDNSIIEVKDVIDESLISFLNNSSKVIVFYGHSFMFNQGKDVYGFKSAIEMFNLLVQKTQQNISLVMCIGENNQAEILTLKIIAEEYEISNKIYWQIGAIKNMNALWNYTDVYIRPTSSDGDSVAVREALNLGVNVVASDVCIRPKGTITYIHNDLNDFSEKVIQALMSKNKEIITDDFYHEMLAVYKKYYEN